MMNARLATSDLRHAAPQRSASLRLCVKKTALLLSPLRPLGGRHSLLLSPLRPLRGRNKGFTLFELLAVLTVIGIGLAILVGAYGSWGTAHALTGATRVVEAGLQQARTLAVTRRAYVAFSYGSTNRPSVVTSATTGFQSFICTNAVPPVDEVVLRDLVQDVDNKIFVPLDGTKYNTLILEPATPFQRLSGHVRLLRRETHNTGEHTPSLLIFRPDGSIMTDDGITQPNYPYHTIAIQTAEPFPDPSSSRPSPLTRLIRIDPATGLTTTVIKPEAL